MKPTFILFFLLLLLGLVACQQPVSQHIEWPAAQQESKPWTRWWWQGSSVTKLGITAELEALQQAGVGGVEITPIYGVIGDEEQFVNYLSSDWVDLLLHTLEEAQRLGLGVDMATGTGWPFGGPWVDAADACKYMKYETYTLKEGEKLTTPVQLTQESFVRAVTNMVYQLYGIYKEKGENPTGSLSDPELIPQRKQLQPEDLVDPIADNENLQALAIDQVRFAKAMPLQSLMAYSDQGEVADLTEKVDDDGKLEWTAPSGNWTLYAIFEGWHGKMVERAAPGGEGNVIDHFSAEAINHYLVRFDSAFTGRDIGALRAFFNDSYEVDDARGQANWTPKVLEAFEAKRGYDLRQHWPALFGEDSEENNRRVLSDYRETISDLILETFTQEWSNWARKQGAIIRNQAHGSPANILDLYAASEIPETEGTEILRIKFATSAGHVSGKKLISSESATWLNEHFLSNLADVKENIDRYFTGGVNHVFYHGTCYSPVEEAWPGRLFYAAIHANSRNSLWRDFPTLNEYITRTQSVLQTGKPDNDILLYFSAYDRFATPGRELLQHFDGHGPALEGTAFEANAKFLQEQGFAFDYISDRQILALEANAGKLQSGEVSYQTILLPETEFLPVATLENLVNLAKNGATILVHKALPGKAPGLGNLTKRQQQFDDLIGQLPFIQKSDAIQEAAIGEGKILVGDEIALLLAEANIKQETLVSHGLSYNRRSHEAGKFYFINNWSGKPVDGWISLHVEASNMTILDPMTGQIGQAKTRNATDGNTEIYLQIPNGGSLIVDVRTTQAGGSPWLYTEPGGSPMALEGSWKVEFIDGGPKLPVTETKPQLNDWTQWNTDLASFSGTARYTLQFSKPAEEADRWLLDLGEVHESAKVLLNGELVGTLIGPTFQIPINNSQLKADNTLEIEVSNLMANRIADMDKRGVFWKKFYNVNFPARRAKNRGKGGLFDASNWTPLPSGLLGPVTLTPLKSVH